MTINHCLPEQLMDIYNRLNAHYQTRKQWPADSALEFIIAILSGAMYRRRVKHTILKLKRAGALNIRSLFELSEYGLADLIRTVDDSVSHYGDYKAYKKRTRTLKAFLEHLFQNYDLNLDPLLNQDVDTLRTELLSIQGIDLETADSILLYAAEKPIFVADPFVKGLLNRLKLVSYTVRYEELQRLLMDNLPHDVKLFQKFHVLIVRHGTELCLVRPLCDECPLLSICEHGQDYINPTPIEPITVEMANAALISLCGDGKENTKPSPNMDRRENNQRQTPEQAEIPEEQPTDAASTQKISDKDIELSEAVQLVELLGKHEVLNFPSLLCWDSDSDKDGHEDLLF